MIRLRQFPTFVLLFVTLLLVACQPIQAPPPNPDIGVSDPVAVPPDEAKTRGGPATATAAPLAEPAVRAEDRAAAEQLVAEGQSLFAAEKYDQAIARYTEAIALDPELADAYFRRAVASMRLGEYAAAIADLDEVLRRRPNHVEGVLYRGAAQAYLGEFEAAIVDLTEAIRRNPTSVDAHVYRGASHFFVKHYALAVQDCTDAVRLSGGYFLPAQLCLSVMGELASPDFEDLDAALADYDAAIAGNDAFAAAYLFRGLAYRSRGDMAATVRDLSEALRLQPQLFDLLIMYWSFAYRNPPDRTAAVAELEAALALAEPDSVLASIIASSLDTLRKE